MIKKEYQNYSITSNWGMVIKYLNIYGPYDIGVIPIPLDLIQELKKVPLEQRVDHFMYWAHQFDEGIGEEI